MTHNEKANLRELALSCRTRTEFARKFNPQYQRIMRVPGLADELFRHMPKPKRWTREELEKIGTLYHSRSEWLAKSPHTFQAAHRRKLVDEVAPPSRRGKHLHEANQ